MSSPEKIIHCFPPEIWALITSNLDARNMRKLIEIGDRRLTRCLMRGGIDSLSFHTNGLWSDKDSWPTEWLRRLGRLKTLKVSRTEGNVGYSARSRAMLPFKNMKPLPELTTLDLSGYIMNRQPTGSTIPDFLKALPKSLLKLCLPNLTINGYHCPLFPSSLTYLSLGQSALQAWGLKELPTDLQHLLLWNDRLCDWEDFGSLPSDLRTFELHDQTRNLNSGALLSLPSNLTRLKITLTMTVPIRLLPQLPTTLQSLQLIRATLQETQFEHWKMMWPANLTDIAVRHISGASLVAVALDELPPNLRSFGLYDASNVTPNMFYDLPPTLTSLVFRKARRLNNRNFKNVPPNLTSFTISGSSLHESSLRNLPPSLKHLDTGGITFSGDGDGFTFMFPRLDLPNLITWKSSNSYQACLRVPHPFTFLRTYERPTLLRTIGHIVARMDGPTASIWFARGFLAYLFIKNGWIIFPAAPTVISNILVRYRNSVLGIGLTILYALR